MIRRLEVEHARVHNLPDSEFSDAYMSFRSQLETTLAKFVGGFIADYTTRFIMFFVSEGVTPRDNDTFTLDPGFYCLKFLIQLMYRLLKC